MRRSLPSPRPAAFPPHPPPPTWSALFGASSVLCSRPTPPAFRGSFALLSFPPRPKAAVATAGSRRSPRFRRDPFVRELVSDPGRAAVPRITAPLMLPSALWTASAPALQLISWLNTDPHDRCVRFAVVVTFHAATLATGGRYPLPGPDFHRLDRASFAWRTQSETHSSHHPFRIAAASGITSTASRISRMAGWARPTRSTGR